MTDVTDEEIYIRNEMYETYIETGVEMFKGPNRTPGKSPMSRLEETISFFKSLGTLDGDRKSYNLQKLREDFYKGAA